MAQIDTAWVPYLSPVIAAGSAYLVWRASQRRMVQEQQTRDLEHHEHLFDDAIRMSAKWREACEACEQKVAKLNRKLEAMEQRVDSLLEELDEWRSGALTTEA